MKVVLILAVFFAMLIAPCRSYAETFVFVPRTNGTADKTIARFRVDESTGQLKPLARDTVVKGISKTLTLVLSADERFLYAFHRFDADTDGYSLDSVGTDTAKEIENRPTPIAVFRVEADGALRQVQTLAVPGPVGQLAPHPGGRWIYALTDEGAFLIKNTPSANTPLRYVSRVAIQSGMGLLSVVGERDAWWLTFSPKGNYLYDFWGDGFVDHAENYLQRYKINPATGVPTPDGAQWADPGELSSKPEPGAVWFFVNRTAFMKGFAQGFYSYPVDTAGRIIVRSRSLSLMPASHGSYYMTQSLTRHAKLPLVIYRGSLTAPYTIWQVTAPGKVVKVGKFPSAFTDGKWQTSLAAEPGGRFLYETSGGGAGKYSYAIWKLKAKGDGATLTAVLGPLPQGIGMNTEWIFVSVPEVSHATRVKTRK